MAIKITSGPAGSGSPTIIFLGAASNGNGSVNISNVANRITARINTTDADYVEVVDDFLTFSNGTEMLDIQPTHYSEWVDEDDNTFQNSGDIIGYIDGFKLTAAYHATYVRTLQVLPNCHHNTSTVDVTVGTAFTFSASNYHNGIGFFWDESSFPNGVEVSRYDRRVISGIITQAGSYDIDLDVVNQSGITSAHVHIDATQGRSVL